MVMRAVSIELPDIAKLKYPVYASVKIDGIRGLVKDKMLSRTLIEIPNKHLQTIVKRWL